MLAGDNIVAGYGKADPILHDIRFDLQAGEMVTIIGPNGAGKSTLLKAVSGLLKPRSGRVLLDGQDICGLPPREIAKRGLVLVPQERNIFGSMTVRENLEIAGYLEKHGVGKKVNALLERFSELAKKSLHQARTLSGGQRQTLAMAMALMRSPKVLLLDEPTAGLSPVAAGRLFDIIRDVLAEGIGIMMVEQNAVDALDLADRAYILVDGRNAMSGRAGDLARSEDVRRLFLGLPKLEDTAPAY
jgi:branched-chain amino acid transport system ATP-binding protein